VVRRRTSLLMDLGKPVDHDLVERLCRLVHWAPNHRRTWPWQIAVFRDESRYALGSAFADDQVDAGETDPVRIDKARRKYGRAPVVVVIGSVMGTSDEMRGENRDAASAGIQNLLLGATAAGLASFWSTPPGRSGSRVLSLCGFETATELVGVVYLGWPSDEVPVPERPALPITLHS
jgi:nitroreductase